MSAISSAFKQKKKTDVKTGSKKDPKPDSPKDEDEEEEEEEDDEDYEEEEEDEESDGQEDAKTKPAPVSNAYVLHNPDADEAEEEADKDEESKDSEETSSQQECCVCLDAVELPLKIPCGHLFCFLCLKGVFSEAKKHMLNPCCPLCRGPVSEDFFHKAEMKKNEYEARQAKSKVQYQWEYAGKDGWWLYDNTANETIEAFYEEFVKNGPPATPYAIRVGADMYNIDFSLMVQQHSVHVNRKRAIRREKKQEVFTNPALVKGQAGVRFARSDSLTAYK